MYWVSWLTTNTAKKTLMEKVVNYTGVAKKVFSEEVWRDKTGKLCGRVNNFLNFPRKVFFVHIIATIYKEGTWQRQSINTMRWMSVMTTNKWYSIWIYMIYLNLSLCLQLTTRTKDKQMWMWYTDRICLCHLHLQLITKTRTKCWISF